MTLKRKLTTGLGFLFLIIFALVIFYSYHLGRLSQYAENILKDNYKSQQSPWRVLVRRRVRDIRT